MRENRDNVSGKSRILDYINHFREDGLLNGDLAFSLEMLDNTDMLLRGCRQIVKYTANEMILRAKRFDVSVSGEGLKCATYHLEGVEIEGEIREIKFILRG